MKELAIGEVGVIEGKRVKCVVELSEFSCHGCAFESPYCAVGQCSSSNRSDGNDIIYIEVKEDEK